MIALFFTSESWNMTSSIVMATQKCKKRRRSRCIHTKRNTENVTKSTHSFIMTVLLVAFAVVVRGESQTLRHYRQQQHGIGAVSTSTSPSVEKQHVIHKPTEAANGNPDKWSHDNNKNGGTIINSLFQGSDDKELQEKYQYAIGQYSSSEPQSNDKNDESKTLVPLISIQTVDIGRNDSIDASENNFTDGTMDYLEYFNIEIDSIKEKHGNGSIAKNPFHDPEEKDVYYNYAIGNGEEEQKQLSNAPSRSPVKIPIQRHSGEDGCLGDDCIGGRSVCIVPDYECCSNADCIHDDDICVHRNCINDGYFRFTLTWIGDDDYDLFVITPDGTEISYNNIFDPISLGKLESEVDQEVYGYHVENIYFPIEGGPLGVYRFFVRPFITIGEVDEWTIIVKEAGNLVAAQSGLGSSEFFFCKKDGQSPTKHPTKPPTQHPVISPTSYYPTRSPLKIISPMPTSPTITPMENPVRPPLGQSTMVPVGSPPPVPTISTGSHILNRPKPEPPVCSSVEEECCIDTDCAGSTGGLCIQRACINEGSLRITLEWIGDDDLHLFVETPTNAAISNNLDVDTESGGRHESSEESTYGFNVESVYFPLSGAPTGTYNIYIDAFAIDGVGADVWTIRIYENGELSFQETGFSDSTVYSYNFESASNPQMQSGLCNFDSACTGDTQVCVRDVCVSEGNPRFTLQWTGESFYWLTVVTPDGRHISAFSPFDADSGGIFEGPTQQLTQGHDVESIYFPIEGGPPGLYTYYITNSVEVNSKESWIATVYVKGKSVAMQTGSGSSTLFSFQLGGSSLPEDVLNELQRNVCNTTSDCILLDTFCIKQICIEQGTPQFVLSWDGYNDISLSVVTPFQTTLSSQNPSDLESGGKFERFDITNDSKSHIESIYFAPEQGPAGVYPFYIHSNDDKGDTWTVNIFVDGEEIVSYNGHGTSEILFFDYSGNPTIVEPPDQEQCDPAKTECCLNTGCSSNEICAYNACVKKGAPQFLLLWEGDCDIALTVVTPAATTISWHNPLDLESGGKFEEYVDVENDRRIENIYVAPDKGPFGVYPYYIHSFKTDSDQDNWTLSIYIDGQEVSTEHGQGSSEVLFFDYSGNLSTMPPTMPPSKEIQEEEECDPLAVTDGGTLALIDGECCSDSDCFSNEACTSRTCVDEGNPRFTLSWKGANDLDLVVVTPLETVLSYSNLEDPLSGGKFGEDYDQFEYGLHVENIYFPSDDAPIGEYSFYVRSFLSQRNDNEWTVGVYVNGEEQLSISGTGSSKELTYTFSPTFS